jgi:dolichol kinase
MPFDTGLLIKELSRKSIHISGFLIPLFYYFFLSRDAVILLLGVMVAAAGILEAIRLSGNPIFPGFLLRGHEEKGVPGAYFFALLSSLIAVMIFDKTIAIAAMLFLDIGDAASGLAGVIWSMYHGRKEAGVRSYDSTKEKNIFKMAIDDIKYALTNHKSPVLMAVMFCVCFFISILLYPGISMPMAVAGSVGAVIADAFPWRIFGFTIDDNLSIPLLSGILMAIFSLY